MAVAAEAVAVRGHVTVEKSEEGRVLGGIRALDKTSVRSLQIRAKVLGVCELLSNDDDPRFEYVEHWASGLARARWDTHDGDEAYLYFAKDRALVKGYAHESIMSAYNPPAIFTSDIPTMWPGLFDQVPEIFSAAVADSGGQGLFSFCYWYEGAERGWQSGVREVPVGDDPDGAVDVLEPYLLEDEQALWWIQNSFDFNPRQTAALRKLMRGSPVDRIILRAFRSLPTAQVTAGLAQIGWPAVDL